MSFLVDMDRHDDMASCETCGRSYRMVFPCGCVIEAVPPFGEGRDQPWKLMPCPTSPHGPFEAMPLGGASA